VGYSGEGEHRFRKKAERRSGAKVNSSRSEATLARRLWSKCSESSSEIVRSEAEAGFQMRGGFGDGCAREGAASLPSLSALEADSTVREPETAAVRNS